MAPKTTLQFLEAVKRRQGISSDYAAAKLLGVTRQQVSHYRSGKSGFSDVTAVRIAELLGVPEIHVIAARNYERANRTEEKALWMELARKAVGATIGLMLVGFLATGDHGFELIAAANAAIPTIDYTSFSIGAAVLALVAAFLALRPRPTSQARPAIA
jgi:predicted transcriptional regulator